MALLKLNGYSGEAEVAGIPRKISVDENGLHIHGVSVEEASDLLCALGAGEIRAYQPAGVKTGAMEFAFTINELGAVKAPESLEKATEKAACVCDSGECNGHQEKAADPEPAKPEPEPEEVPESKKAAQVSEPTSKEEKAPAPKNRTRAAAPKKSTKSTSVVDDMTKDPEDMVSGSPDDPEETVDDSIVVNPEEEAGTDDSTVEDDSTSKVAESDAAEEESEESGDSSGGDQSPLFGQLLAATTMREVINAFQDHGIEKLSAIQKEAGKYQASVTLLKNAGSALPVRLARTAKGMGIK